MRVMVIIKATEQSEASQMPSSQFLAEMGAFNEQLVDAGVMLGGEGLLSSAKGKRVRLTRGGKSTVLDGPFAETKELVAGFWLWKVASMDEAVEWVRRIPAPPVGEGPDVSEVEIRPVAEAEDFGEAFTAQEREREERMRKQLEGRR